MRPEYVKTIRFSVTEDDFCSVFDRKPKDWQEFEKFVKHCEEYLASQINWNTVFAYVEEVLTKGMAQAVER